MTRSSCSHEQPRVGRLGRLVAVLCFFHCLFFLVLLFAFSLGMLAGAERWLPFLDNPLLHLIFGAVAIALVSTHLLLHRSGCSKRALLVAALGLLFISASVLGEFTLHAHAHDHEHHGHDHSVHEHSAHDHGDHVHSDAPSSEHELGEEHVHGPDCEHEQPTWVELLRHRRLSREVLTPEQDSQEGHDHGLATDSESAAGTEEESELACLSEHPGEHLAFHILFMLGNICLFLVHGLVRCAPGSSDVQNKE